MKSLGLKDRERGKYILKLQREEVKRREDLRERGKGNILVSNEERAQRTRGEEKDKSVDNFNFLSKTSSARDG